MSIIHKEEKLKFGFPAQMYEEFIELNNLINFYGFTEEQAELCYKIHLSKCISLQDAFEWFYNMKTQKM